MKILILLLAILTLSSQAWGQTQCVDLFAARPNLQNDFSEIDIIHNEAKPTKSSTGVSKTSGYVMVTGLDRKTGNWAVIGTVEYQIKGDLLNIKRLIERPEFYGQRVYLTMIESIVQRNLQIKNVAVSLTGTFFSKYKEDLAALENPIEAIKANPVFKQFEQIGFKDISYYYELSNTQQVYLRLVVTRPFI